LLPRRPSFKMAARAAEAGSHGPRQQERQ
jgi:hypothetical protein